MSPEHLPVSWAPETVWCGFKERGSGDSPVQPASEPDQVCRPGQGSSRALTIEEIYGDFRFPLYLKALRRGHGHDDSCDLTQDFFLVALRHGYLDGFYPLKGCLATFVHMLFGRFLSKSERRMRAAKHGGGHILISLEAAPVCRQVTDALCEIPQPEYECDRCWARDLLARVIRAARRSRPGARLCPSHRTLPGRAPGARRLMSGSHAMGRCRTPAAIRTQACRARRRLRMELAKALRSEYPRGCDVEEETGYLFAVMEH